MVAAGGAGAQVPGPGAAVPGSELTIYVMTMGQGDQVWERYGHNAIGIRDASTGSDIVYNWGIFSFEEPGFLGRFLRGEMMYWMAGQDAAGTLANYQYFNRTVEIQELDLSPPQRIMLRDFIEWNARDENKFYRYDYFLDNCSTRVRDALDRVLGGAIRQATDTLATGHTYRWHSLRLMAEDPLLSAGIDIGLGRPTDRPISAWEEMFIPMKVRDRLREIRVPDDSGRLVPLVTSERVLFQATRTPERDAPPRRLPWLALAGVALGGAVVWLRRRVPGGGRPARAAAVVVALVLGAMGAALVFLRLATQHTAAWHNTNLFVYNPLWLPLVVLPFLRGDGVRRAAHLLASAVGILAGLGVLAALVPPFRQGSLAVIALAAPVALVTAVMLREQFRPGA